MWAGAAMAFRQMGQMMFQVQLAKSIDDDPITRDYIAETERHYAWLFEWAITGSRRMLSGGFHTQLWRPQQDKPAGDIASQNKADRTDRRVASC